MEMWRVRLMRLEQCLSTTRSVRPRPRRDLFAVSQTAVPKQYDSCRRVHVLLPVARLSVTSDEWKGSLHQISRLS